MKKYIIYIFAVCLLFTGACLSGCDSFEDVNTNPDSSTKVTSGMLASNLILSIMREDNGASKNCIREDLLGKYLAWTEEGDIDLAFNRLSRGNFGGLTILNNIKRMVDFAPTDELRNSYQALGHFVRCKRFFDLTMRLGDISYTEAMQGDNDIFYPSYDSQKTVFLGLLNELDKADSLFAKGARFDGDVVYSGEPAKWRKAVNVLQLKLLINLYKKADDADLKVKQRFQTLISRPIFTSNDDNCQLVYSDKAGQKYPFYKEGNSYLAFHQLSSIVIDTLKLMNDRRVFYYAKPTPQAAAAGMSISDWDAYIGVNPTMTFKEIQETVNQKNVSQLNDRYVELPNCEPIFLLSYAEMNFILAEAAVRGLLSGSAKPYYEEGIRASMKFTADNTPDNPVFHHNMKITDEYIADYLQGTEVTFANSAAKQIRQIIIQKYMTTFLQTPYNAYYEYRRTGIPAFPINPASNRNVPPEKMPMRWIYPQNEYDYNGDNVTKAVANQYASDDYNEIMWILK